MESDELVDKYKSGNLHAEEAEGLWFGSVVLETSKLSFGEG